MGLFFQKTIDIKSQKTMIMSMKINKTLSVIQLTVMYVSIILVYIPAIILLNSNTYTITNNPYNPMFIAGFIIIILALIISLTIVIISVIASAKGKDEDMTKFTLIIKLAAIPWFVANYVMWFLLVLGMLNPILFLAIPITIALSMTGTYVLMMSSSLNNIVPLIGKVKRKEIKLKPLLMIGIIFQFIFCLDILGAIFVMISNKTNK